MGGSQVAPVPNTRTSESVSDISSSSQSGESTGIVPSHPIIKRKLMLMIIVYKK